MFPIQLCEISMIVPRIEYLSEVDLNEQYREVLRSSTGDIPAVKILLSKLSDDDERRYLEIGTGDNRRCLIGALSAGQIHQLYQKHKGTYSISIYVNYVGDTRTNRDIMTTASEEPNNFFYYKQWHFCSSQKDQCVRKKRATHI